VVPAHADQLDKTGIDWVLPFEKALAKAKAEKRILLIKPIAVGSVVRPENPSEPRSSIVTSSFVQHARSPR